MNKLLVLFTLLGALASAPVAPASAGEITVASVCRKAQTEGPAGASRQYAKAYCAFLTTGSVKLAAAKLGLNAHETGRQVKLGAPVFNTALSRSSNVN